MFALGDVAFLEKSLRTIARIVFCAGDAIVSCACRGRTSLFTRRRRLSFQKPRFTEIEMRPLATAARASFITAMQSKEDIRRSIRAVLPEPPDIRAGKSARLCAAIAGSARWQNARTVVLFAPQPREPDVEMLWVHATGKTIAYPRVEDDRLGLYSVASLHELRPARWGIREPAADLMHAVAPDAVELILVPGTAFTREGTRMGRGGGFYDRLLAGLTPAACKIGVCFDYQIVPELPIEPHDQSVDFIATESGLV